MTTPVVFDKPISARDRLLIDTVTARYEGIDTPFIVFEDEKTITLRVPENFRRRCYGQAVSEAKAPDLQRVPDSTRGRVDASGN